MAQHLVKQKIAAINDVVAKLLVFLYVFVLELSQQITQQANLILRHKISPLDYVILPLDYIKKTRDGNDLQGVSDSTTGINLPPIRLCVNYNTFLKNTTIFSRHPSFIGLTCCLFLR